MRIFDCVLVENARDLDLLEIRMTEMQDIPEVTHVICEAPADHKGSPKGKHFLAERYSDRFFRWHGRWNHVEVEPHELPAGAEPKVRRDALREYLSHGVNSTDPRDVILHGGIDEIPAEWAVRQIAEGRISLLPVALEMRWCAYSPGKVHPRAWRGTVAQHWGETGSFSGMREKKGEIDAIVGAGTRLSMWGEPEQQVHPDGTYLWDADIDDTCPRAIREGSWGVSGASP